MLVVEILSSFPMLEKENIQTFFIFMLWICSTQLTFLPNFLLSFTTENLNYRPAFILSFNLNRIKLKSFYPGLIFMPGLSSWLITTESSTGIRNLLTLACDKPVDGKDWYSITVKLFWKKGRASTILIFHGTSNVSTSVKKNKLL